MNLDFLHFKDFRLLLGDYIKMAEVNIYNMIKIVT